MPHQLPAVDEFLLPLGDGVYAIDTGFQRPRFDAAYLIVEGHKAAFVDTGTNFAVPRLLAALSHLGLGHDAVDWVIPTHVHLDHAGGVGLLMQALPNAKLMVHPRGARHLIDPSALYAGALAVYGAEAMAREYGMLVPVPADRVDTSSDGGQLQLNGRLLHFIDTPGHARHHHCIWDERSRSWFTGDTFGLAYPELSTERGPLILPTSSPVQFEPDALHQSIDRLMATQPVGMYLTHFGRVGDLPRLAQSLHRQIDAMVAMAREVQAQGLGDRRHAALHSGLTALARQALTDHGLSDVASGLASLSIDLELNAQGLAVWLDREAAA